jgi:large subunit ribosomal protein L4e
MIFMEAEILSLDGKVKGKIELPKAFDELVRPELIQRAVVAENTRKLQPQAHYPLAGMNTSAMYYGAMNSYRSGRHMGIAIRPRQKLGGGVQGQVRVVPSAVKGKRAHPHLAEKIIKENINKREYQKALASAVSATNTFKTNKSKSPIILTNEIESIKKTKELLKIFSSINLLEQIKEDKQVRIKKGLRRSSIRKHYKKSVLLVTGKDARAIKAARNIAGVDACEVSNLTANLLAPGGVPGRMTVWSESAIKELDASLKKQNLT